ncbi:MAG TPA: HAMP domain-containing histidine kinase [Acidiferrobacteraceae bacterium]|nr:HAMP domain-containing histidine kinase [Acidiferrobacteraceae bacterium]
MKIRISLRYRVTLTFALLGMGVSLGLAGALYVLAVDMEERLTTETLSVELEDYIVRYKVDPKTPPPASTTMRTYVIAPGEKGAPAVLRDLDTGLHQVQLEGGSYYAEVQRYGELNFIVLYDDKQIRHRKYQFKIFLGIGVWVMTFLSAVLGFWLARRVILPVKELAASVANLQPEDCSRPLADDFLRDEVGILARKFDDYRQRLGAFIEREQTFTADVSHELRTPLAVIEGATEILLGDPGLGDTRRSRVERIARAAREMSELVTTLLLLAREDKGDVSKSGCAVAELLQQVLEGHQHLLRHKSVEVKLDIQAQTTLSVECTLLRVVLANLIRNAFYYTEQGQVSICLDEEGISIKDTGIGIPKKNIQRIFDRHYTGPAGSEGIGLSLVKRICRCCGWNIEIASHEGQGTIIRLLFLPTPTGSEFTTGELP